MSTRMSRFTALFLSLASVMAHASGNDDYVFAGGIGGYEYTPQCYNGNFISGVVCNEYRASYALGRFDIQARAEVSMVAPTDPDDAYFTRALVAVTLTVVDADDFFNPEGKLPVLVRGIRVGYHRRNAYSVESLPVTFEREEGTRRLVGKVQFLTTSVSGAEYTQVLNKIEVLLPGVPGTAVLSFGR